MERNPASHKGENGKVAVIGGSRTIHGAPILSALAAEAAGVDLVFVCLPACHEETAKASALNFQVHPFRGNELEPVDAEAIVELLATMDSAVLGPGIARTAESIGALEDSIAEASCKLVLDATALQPGILEKLTGKIAVLTPHLGELERMERAEADLPSVAREHAVTIHVKGSIDRIYDATGKKHEVSGGNAGLTVGGTGDVLAGLIAGLLAQNVKPAEACIMASTVIKRAGTVLFHERGYSYRAADVIAQIPHLLHTL